MTHPDTSSDGLRSYHLGLASLREICIRKRQISPRPGDEREQRWARDGMVEISALDTVKNDGAN